MKPESKLGSIKESVSESWKAVRRQPGKAALVGTLVFGSPIAVDILMKNSDNLKIGTAEAATNGPFKDVPANHPQAQAITEMKDLGIMIGYADGKFGPEDPLLRQQFAKVITLAFELPIPDQRATFNDVEQKRPYPLDYVEAVFAHGSMRGKDNATFAPRENVSVLQAISTVVRTIDSLYPKMLPEVPKDFQGYLPPEDLGVHAETFRKANAYGLLNDTGDYSRGFGSERVWKPITRAFIAQLLNNSLKFIEAHPERIPGQEIHVGDVIFSDFPTFVDANSVDRANHDGFSNEIGLGSDQIFGTPGDTLEGPKAAAEFQTLQEGGFTILTGTDMMVEIGQLDDSQTFVGEMSVILPKTTDNHRYILAIRAKYPDGNKDGSQNRTIRTTKLAPDNGSLTTYESPDMSGQPTNSAFVSEDQLNQIVQTVSGDASEVTLIMVDSNTRAFDVLTNISGNWAFEGSNWSGI